MLIAVAAIKITPFPSFLCQTYSSSCKIRLIHCYLYSRHTSLVDSRCKYIYWSGIDVYIKQLNHARQQIGNYYKKGRMNRSRDYGGLAGGEETAAAGGDGQKNARAQKEKYQTGDEVEQSII